MHTALKIGCFTAAIGLALHAAPAAAAVAQHFFASNAINYCQAFTPGPSNTIRNRVIGSENIGSTMAVACNFHSMINGAAGNSAPTVVEMWFSNNSSAAITITCTLLTGYQGDGDAYLVTKTTAPIPGGGTSQDFLSWTPADNPTAGATDLGNILVGVNCTLPTGAVMNDTYIAWSMDNGV